MKDKQVESPFDKFQKLAKRVVSVPKTEIERREAAWRKQQKAKS